MAGRKFEIIFACAATVFATVASPELYSAQKLNGASIYAERCAKCHGRNGEGVKGKYDDALYGDWSVEKLTRIIAKTMPEDDPGTCKGPEAAAVAQYVHDTFYSREARARNKPARVELARLTNRQYVNTVADLLRSFGTPDPARGDEQGLRGTYNKSQRNRDGSKAFDRLDATVDFNFRDGSPYDEGKTTNGFSIHWRGSVFAEESGDHEFIVVTPNGARLWVNDEETPVIDASVASGDMTEHKATVKLLGGRAYPIRLEMSRAPKDKVSSIALKWRQPRGAAGVVPKRNLSPARVAPTFVVHTPFPPDDSSVGYERGVSVSKAWYEATTQAAIEVANHVVKQLDRLSNSKGSDAERAKKVEMFCADFVSGAFRRPLNPQERRVYVESHFSGDAKPEDAAKRAVMLALKSPRFLYIGISPKADDHEVASRLALAIWDSVPDKELGRAAAAGLRTKEQVSAQARRMLADPRARAKTRHFLHHWLQMEHLEGLDKDDEVFPEFTDDVAADLRISLNLFLDDVVWSADSDYRDFLLADYIYVNDRLAKFYGLTNRPGNDFVKVKFDPLQRSGLLTHPYLLAAFSYQKSTSPIHRGVFLTRNIVGRALKPPPIAVAFKETDFAPNLTMREKVSELTRPEACQTCHSVINPLGFSLEHFDAVGRFRTRENDKPIDAVSDYLTDDGAKIRLGGARDVARFAINSEHAQSGFVEQLFHEIVKQPVLAYGSNRMEQLRQAFVASGFNIQKLMVEIATVSALQGVATPDGAGAIKTAQVQE